MKSLRARLIVVMTALVALISLAVFLYFPARLRQQALQAVGAKAESIAEMTAYNVAPALVFADRTAAMESFEGARRNRDLVYLVVEQADGTTFASYPADVVLSPQRKAAHRGGVAESGAVYETSAPIQHNGRVIGRLYMALSLAGVNAQLQESRAAVALVSLFLFLFGVAAVTLISAYMTGPLLGIVEAVEQIAAGRLHWRAKVTTRDEVGHLARSLNAMVDQLESLHRDLEGRVEERTHALAASENRYRLLFERNLAGVYRTTVDGEVLDCNDACARIFGHENREGFLRSRATDLFHDPAVRKDLVERLRQERSISNVELCLRRPDGTPIWVLESVSLLDDDRVIEGTVIDITDRKEAERQIEHQAYHDALTGLPNRALFTDRVNIAVARSRRKQTMAAVLFVDLDRFKYVNDTFGHSAGDVLLQHVAQRLRVSVREEDTVARLGGDEFTLLLSDLGSATDAVKVAQKLITAMSTPFTVYGHEFYITPSIGIALFPNDGGDVDTLLRNADNAMYRAKEAGPNQYHLYSEAVNRRASMRLSLEASLRHAIERDELVVHYQPQVNAENLEVVGLEALVRWQHPERGLLQPEQFIGVAEEANLIAGIDEWVLREACRQARAWEDDGFKVRRLAVNLSATQLRNSALPQVISRAIELSAFDPSRLELEITESAAVRTDGDTVAVLDSLRRSGIRISIDDFGMGHSALHYLHQFPVDTIKIDRNFVHGICGNPRTAAIVSAIVSMARAMDLGVIAEGVETPEQLAMLRQLGCSEVQGFLFSAPVPAAEIPDLVRRLREPTTPAVQPGL